MHIAEGLLPLAHCVGWYAISAPFVIHGAWRVTKQVKEQPESKLLLAAAGAFSLVVSSIKLPSATGSSSHPTGTGLGAVLFRPPVMAFLSTIVLTFQALLLAHGGLTTLGANVFSMGIVGPWVGYWCWLAAQRLGWRVDVGVFLAMAAADLATYLTTSVQLAVVFPDPVSGLPGALAKFIGVFAVTQLPLAVAEGILGVLVFRLLHDVARPELERLGVLRPAADQAVVG